MSLHLTPTLSPIHTLVLFKLSTERKRNRNLAHCACLQPFAPGISDSCKRAGGFEGFFSGRHTLRVGDFLQLRQVLRLKLDIKRIMQRSFATLNLADESLWPWTIEQCLT